MPGLVVDGFLTGPLVTNGIGGGAPVIPPTVSVAPVAVSPLIRLLVRRRPRNYTQPVRMLPSVLALLLQYRRPSGPAAPGTVDDLLSALIQYLRNEPTVAAVLPVDKQGRVQVYSEMAPVGTVRPYVVIDDYTEQVQYETIEDLQHTLTVCILAEGLDQTTLIENAVEAAIDPLTFNNRSLGRDPLTWTNGSEVTAIQINTKKERLGSFGAGGKYVYREEIAYQFWVTPVSS